MDNFIMMPVPASMFTAVCALLGGASATAITISNAKPASAPAAPVSQDKPADAVTEAAASENVELDAHGWPWLEDLHASTKSKTKEGLWRLKVGASRPDPKPGYPKDDGTISTANGGTDSSAPVSATAPNAGSDDDDEFAAFRAAAAASDKPATVPARKWTDADLSALCNQAATKLGDPAPIKAIIGDHVPEGQVPHSRNIPEDQREAFAKAIEAKAGIEFAG